AEGRTAGRPLRVGLTGSIGAGKSTVARLLAARGAAVIDADALAREATEDPEVLAAVARELGEDLLVAGHAGPALDRAATAARVAARSGLGADEVARREAAQMPAEEKVARADHVVVNAGDLDELEAQVSRLWRELTTPRTRSLRS